MLATYVDPSMRICCREICRPDVKGIIDLLTSGFGNRSRESWERALGRLSEHATPPGFPKYGYLLECNGSPVGVILLIFSSVSIKGKRRIRCNVSSWYVQPAFRSYAAMLGTRALKHKSVTYFNVSPRHQTVPILEAQGYSRYCNGWFVSIPALSAHSYGPTVEVVARETCSGEDLQPHEIELLLDHAGYGCLSVICSWQNRRYPFVFAPRWKYRVVPLAQLVFCRDRADFVRFAGALGRFLIGHGFPLVVLDANGPVQGLIGMYVDHRPKYFKGSYPPTLGDLAYSELAMFS